MEVSVSLVLFSIVEGELSVLVIGGHDALPENRLSGDDTLDSAVRDLLHSATGQTDAGHLEQLRTFSEVGRVLVAYLGLAPGQPAQSPYQLVSVDGLTEAGTLAGVDAEVLGVGISRARAKLEYTPLATAFVTEPFTLPELRRVYEAVWGTRVDMRNFQRKALSSGLVVSAGELSVPGLRPGAPAPLYRRGDVELLHPPMLRERMRV